MQLYYKAVSKEGKIITGIIDANDIRDAAIYLRNKDLIPVNIKKKEKSKLLDFLPIMSSRFKSKDVIVFTRQMSSMLNSGLTLLRSLEILRDQTGSEAMRTVIGGIINDIEEGASFSAAISKYPEAFSRVYMSLVKASEGSGLLDKALLRLSDNLEKQQKLRNTIKSALMYPIIVIMLMGIVVIVMLIFVIPQLSNLYKELNVPLPLPTQIVIAVSNAVVNFWPIFIGTPFVFSFLLRRWRRTEEGRILIDSFILKLPIFGQLIKKTILVEFSRTLGLLIGSGSLVVDSIIETSDVAGNMTFKNAIMEVSERVEKGISVGDAMSVYSLFPPILVQLVKVGEQTGKLDETLLKASEYFESEVDQSVKALTTAMEPIIMVILGIGVMFLIISVITPIYNLTSSIK